MVARETARERDLRALAGIVSERRTDLPDCGLPVSLLADLKDQVCCDGISFESFDSARRTSWFAAQSIPHGGAPLDAELEPVHWGHYWDCEPCSYPDRTGDLRTVIKIADFYSARQWHSTGMYADLYRPQGVEHELMLTFPVAPGTPAGPGRTVRLFLFRGPGPDFSEADRALLTLLRPHLHQAYLDAERRRHPLPRLTPRHRQLLDLLAAGHTNAQIARRLGLAEGTVRTHLENLYRRLQVSSRAEAAARAVRDQDPYAGTGWSVEGYRAQKR
jgi:DNA-binding CsgD family transcriptional regulator